MFSKDLHDEDWSLFHDITVVDDESDSPVESENPNDHLQESYEYSLKAINPFRMSDYKTVKIYEYTQGCFKSLDELRDFMARNLLASFPGSRAGEEERESLVHTVRACAKFPW